MSWQSVVIWVVVLDRAGSVAVQVFGFLFSIRQFNLDLSKQKQVHCSALIVQTFPLKL